MDAKEIRGVGRQDERKDKKKRDLRGGWERFYDFIRNPSNLAILIGVIVFLSFLYPAFGEFYFLIGIWLYAISSNKNYRLPFRMPKSSGLVDQSYPEKNKPAAGIHFFGNDIQTNEELWFDDSDMRTHCLVFGSTGAGKALRMEEKIHTPKGWIKNKNIKINQLVTTPYGTSKVIGVYPQGQLELYRIQFSDDRYIEVSGDHLWGVYLQEHKYIELKQSIANIKDNFPTTKTEYKVIDTITLQKELAKGTINAFVPLSDKVEKPHASLFVPPYILGRIISNWDSENPLYNKLIDKFELRLRRIQFLNNNVNSSADFEIPEVYFDSSISQRSKLLRGIFHHATVI